jgi:iduronate 2-sulfatase
MSPEALGTGRPNVLLIISDDLRPQLGAYGDPLVKTPHLDRFARSALRFDRAYAQQASCSPSRNSFLSGLRPGTTGLRGFGRTLRSAVPDVVTLPQHFQQHGYHTIGLGKIFHVYAETGLGSEDDPASWSEPLWLPAKAPWGPEHEAIRQRLIAEARAAGREFNHSHDWPRGGTWEAPEVPDEELRDGETAARAADFLRSRAGRDEPFFLAVGFYQPHLPYVAPRKYFDLYDPDRLPLPDETPPRGAPRGTFIAGMLDRYLDFPPVEQRDAAFKRRYLQAYLANISYVDACTGRVLDALDAAGLSDTTLVVFLGDHGYFMGEYGSWGHKQANYEMATRSPLLVRAPGMKAAGQATPALVELVDLYATLAGLAGLPAPARHEGWSFAPLLDEPARPWKTAAFSEMPRRIGLGRAIRTDRHRYVEWTNPAGAVVARELYDHRTDPEERENIAGAHGNRALVDDLAARLHAGWPAALPPR